MTYKHNNVARELSNDKFSSATQRYLYLEMAYMSDNKGIIYQTQADIARQLMLSRVTVCKEMAELSTAGMLSKEKRGRYKVNILLERQPTVEAEPAETSEQGPDIERHKFELWSAKHTEELEEGTFILVSDEDTSPEAADYEEQGLISKITDETILYKDGFYFIYKRTS